MIRPFVMLRYIVLLCFLLSVAGCLNAEGLNCGDALDPDFKGCYKRASDERQYIAIIQDNAILDASHHEAGEDECNQLVGEGRGLLAGIGEMREWSFTGRVDSFGHATLTVTLEGDGEERTVTAIHADSVPSQMILNGGERLLKRDTCP
ncbi:MAG: hypothetical protein ACYDGO_09670 [Smithellaceae bacterium]